MPFFQIAKGDKTMTMMKIEQWTMLYIIIFTFSFKLLFGCPNFPSL